MDPAPLVEGEVLALRPLADSIATLQTEVLTAEAKAQPTLAEVAPAYRESARNLVHYLALRHADRRELQLRLLRLGLSSLGRCEAHVLHSVEAVAQRLAEALRVRGQPVDLPPVTAPDWSAATTRLHAHTQALLGPQPQGRHVAIMVTAAWPEASDPAWTERLLTAGMDVLRLNAAHDDAQAWTAMARAARQAAVRVGKPVQILVDLPGPKLRVAEVGLGPTAAHWKPRKDEQGRVLAPLEVALRASGQTGDGPGLTLPDEILERVQPGDRLTFHDLRGKKRSLQVVDGHRAELHQGAFVKDGLEVTLRRGALRLERGVAHGIQGRKPAITLDVTDPLLLRADTGPADPGEREAGGLWRVPPAIGCTAPEVVADLRPGERVLFDDGQLEAVVEAVEPTLALLRVVRTPGGPYKLRGDKGINLPDSQPRLPALGPADREALAFAAQHADVVGLSFVRGPEDVLALHQALAGLPRTEPQRELGVLLKIETQAAFARLPAILLAAMRRHPVGVMIARGDLAVEAGFERLAELQEEILWFCEAAHLPVVWATQVLDTLARTGQPSRAEVTDAAMAVRAECVMLNKGPHILEAVASLDRILRKMEQHQYKKKQLFRRLQVAGQ